jgi:murein DD-endopeptidase MepM/ murein hydrolase activator NlpD
VIIDHENGKQTYYAHLNTISVKAGTRVHQDQQVGTVGSTGRSTGPHLHFEVRVNGTPVNPYNYL